MITRLLELKLASFRAFGAEQTIPLDGDVVLIHGPNGTAKTSLLAGLEFALTGAVCDLQIFGDDYPRCLKHLGATEDSAATVRFRDQDGAQHEIAHFLGTSSSSLRSPVNLTSEEKSFYLERCYLSQSSLSRLLENYQAFDKERPEQPLVRFVRELLGLDLLENLTDGLYEAGNISRIEKSVPALREARETETRAIQKISELEARRTAVTAGWQSALALLQQTIGEVGDLAPNQAWDLAGIEARLKALDGSDSGHTAAERLQKFRHAEGRLQSSLGLLRDDEVVASRRRLQEQLTRAEATRPEIERRLEELLARVRAALREFDFRPSETDVFSVAFHAAARMLFETRNKLDGAARRVAEMSVEVEQRRVRAREIVTALENHGPSARAELASRQRLVELLAGIAQHVHGDECPVCRRDYAELNSGALTERIAAEISNLGSDAQTLENRERQRSGLELELGEINRQIDVFKQRLAVEQPLVERHATQRQLLASLAAECAGAESDGQNLSQLTLTIANLRAELATFDARRQQRAIAVAELSRLANELELTIPVESSAEGITAIITEHLTTRVERLERQLSGETRLRGRLSEARNAKQVLDQIDADLIEARHRLEKAVMLIRKMRRLIDEGKALAKAATNAKQKLLDHVFNDTLNKLWQDLFRRLAKHERFQPRLGEPVAERGRIRTTIEGYAATGDTFSQFAAVASSGNLSTAALSLFLALHLVEVPRHRVLVLDDPVQNMDDVHVVQLASLLRTIARVAKRQIVIAVHERALFDYLCLELSPTTPNGKLLALELQRSHPEKSPQLIVSEHVWSNDRLRFGAVG